MKQEQLQALQPQVFSYFQAVLAQDRLAHAYLFSGDFASFDMAIFSVRRFFVGKKQSRYRVGFAAVAV